MSAPDTDAGRGDDPRLFACVLAAAEAALYYRVRGTAALARFLAAVLDPERDRFPGLADWARTPRYRGRQRAAAAGFEPWIAHHGPATRDDPAWWVPDTAAAVVVVAGGGGVRVWPARPAAGTRTAHADVPAREAVMPEYWDALLAAEALARV